MINIIFDQPPDDALVVDAAPSGAVPAVVDVGTATNIEAPYSENVATDDVQQSDSGLGGLFSGGIFG